MTKKDATSFLVKDLGDLVYEKKITPQYFINTHGSKLMTSVLVVVSKKNIAKFRESYFTVLTDHYEKDQANWKKRTHEILRQ